VPAEAVASSSPHGLDKGDDEDRQGLPTVTCDELQRGSGFPVQHNGDSAENLPQRDHAFLKEQTDDEAINNARRGQPYEVDQDDLLDQHVGYYLRHHPDVHARHAVRRQAHGVYRIGRDRQVTLEWQYASEPGEHGFLVVVDGPLRQPFSDYMEMTENNAQYDSKSVSRSSLSQIPKEQRMSFHDQHKVYTRLEAMKVAKEQAAFREKHADYVKEGKEAPEDLLSKYKKSISQKIGKQSSNNPRPYDRPPQDRAQAYAGAVTTRPPPPPPPPPNAAHVYGSEPMDVDFSWSQFVGFGSSGSRRDNGRRASENSSLRTGTLAGNGDGGRCIRNSCPARPAAPRDRPPNEWPPGEWPPHQWEGPSSQQQSRVSRVPAESVPTSQQSLVPVSRRDAQPQSLTPTSQQSLVSLSRRDEQRESHSPTRTRSSSKVSHSPPPSWHQANHVEYRKTREWNL